MTDRRRYYDRFAICHFPFTIRVFLLAAVLSPLPVIAIVQPPGGRGGAAALAEPFKGVTADGTVVSGLFPIKATGVSTASVRQAAERFLDSLAPEQRQKTAFPVDDVEWRDWNNVHRYTRKGVSFEELSEAQRERAFDMMRAGLSVMGFEKSRGVMRLNGHLVELVNRPGEYGEWLYWITVMGQPSATKPWGWQLDGHHLIVNYFVLGDQVVMTPEFMGSEPISAETGKYAGTVILQDEQNKGLAFMQSLTPDQQKAATIDANKVQNNAQAQAFRDNLVLPHAGVRAADLTQAQRTRLLDVIAEYVGNMAPGHAKVRMDEVRRHLDRTYFAWVGATGAESVFYYRIHSPVILIEFDHQTPVALEGPKVPGRRHVHTVVRTPNGNDYGKDLLRQHYEAQKDNPAHGHQRPW